MSLLTDRNGVSAAAPPRKIRTPAIDRGSTGFTLASRIILIFLAIIWLIPTLWAIKVSFTTNATTSLGAAAVMRDWHLTFHSYSVLLAAGNIWNWYLSSAITALGAVLLTVLFASMAGYALSRLHFRGKGAVMLLVLLGIMVPTQVLVVPQFQELNAVGLLNTYWAVILPQVPAVVAVFIFKQFFDGIPREIEEAARIDGATSWRIYRAIIMPLARPVVAAVSILTFVNVWNNLILPLYTLTTPKLMTIPVGLASVQSSTGQTLSDVQAAALLGALPLVIIYFFFQRRIVEGVAGSAVKG